MKGLWEKLYRPMPQASRVVALQQRDSRVVDAPEPQKEIARSRFVPLEEALSVPRQRDALAGNVKIYALYDERDGRVRYVGMTRASLPRRLEGHLREPTNAAMARYLKSPGSRPAIKLLEHVAKDEWEAAERGWICWFRQRGELLNVDPGGNHRHSDGAVRGTFVGHYEEPRGRKAAGRAAMLGGPSYRPAKRFIDTRKGPVAGHGEEALRGRTRAQYPCVPRASTPMEASGEVRGTDVDSGRNATTSTAG